MIIKAINDAKLIKVSVKPLQRLADDGTPQGVPSALGIP